MAFGPFLCMHRMVHCSSPRTEGIQSNRELPIEYGHGATNLRSTLKLLQTPQSKSEKEISKLGPLVHIWKKNFQKNKKKQTLNFGNEKNKVMEKCTKKCFCFLKTESGTQDIYIKIQKWNYDIYVKKRKWDPWYIYNIFSHKRQILWSAKGNSGK